MNDSSKTILFTKEACRIHSETIRNMGISAASGSLETGGNEGSIESMSSMQQGIISFLNNNNVNMQGVITITTQFTMWLKNTHSIPKDCSDKLLKVNKKYNSIGFLFLVLCLFSKASSLHGNKLINTMVKLSNGIICMKDGSLIGYSKSFMASIWVLIDFNLLVSSHIYMAKRNIKLLVFSFNKDTMKALFSELGFTMVNVSNSPDDLFSIYNLFKQDSSMEKKLNYTPVYINKDYYDFLMQVFSDFNLYMSLSYIDINNKNNLIEFNGVKGWLSQLPSLTNNFTIPIFFSYYPDTRGRVYTHCPFSHQQAQVLRLLYSPTPIVCSIAGKQLMSEFVNYHFKSIFKKEFSYDECYSFLKENWVWPSCIKYSAGCTAKVFWNMGALSMSGFFHTLELDACCSGYQHFSMLMRNARIGSMVGLGPMESTWDIYESCGHALMPGLYLESPILFDKVEGLITNGPDDLTYRSLMKQPVMMTLYGASHTGLYKDHFSQIIKVPNFTHKEMFKVSMIAYKSIYMFVDDLSINKKVGWLCSKSSSSMSMKIKGFMVNNKYRKKDQNLDLWVRSGSGKHHIHYDKIFSNKIDYGKSITSTFVNAIHCLDSRFLLGVINKSEFPLLPIHDCFITDITSVSPLYDLCKDQMYTMYVDFTILDLIDGIEGLKDDKGIKNKYSYIKTLPPLFCKDLSGFSLLSGIKLDSKWLKK